MASKIVKFGGGFLVLCSVAAAAAAIGLAAKSSTLSTSSSVSGASLAGEWLCTPANGGVTSIQRFRDDGTATFPVKANPSADTFIGRATQLSYTNYTVSGNMVTLTSTGMDLILDPQDYGLAGQMVASGKWQEVGGETMRSVGLGGTIISEQVHLDGNKMTIHMLKAVNWDGSVTDLSTGPSSTCEKDGPAR